MAQHWRFELASGRTLRAGGLLLLLLLTAEQARGQDAVRLCREKGTDDDLRPIPQSLLPAAKKIFGLSMPNQQVLHSTVYRCADGHVLLCTYGANLSTGGARRLSSPLHKPKFPDSGWLCSTGLPVRTVSRLRPSWGRSARRVQVHLFVAMHWTIRGGRSCPSNPSPTAEPIVRGLAAGGGSQVRTRL
jgi:hypothetical protein